MRANRRINTKPEVALRSLLHRRGYRFRKDFPIVIQGKRIRPDIVFTRRRLAVFVDGCFWHACPDHCDKPKSNIDYWIPKLQRNTEKDRVHNQLLAADDWTVLRIWEHVPASEALELVVTALAGRRSA